MTATTSFFLIVYSLLLYNFVSVDAASFTGVLPVTSTTFPTPHPVADSTSKMSSSAAASSLCATLRRSSRLSTRTSSPYFASKGSVDSGDNAPTSSRYFSEQDAGIVGDVFTDKIDRLKDNGKNSPKSTTKLDSSGDSISPAIKRRKKSNTSTSPTQKMQSATPQKISSKKAKSKGSSKKKESKIKPTIQRTQSFEPAWWGNVLSTASHPHVATNLSKPKAEYKHDQYSPIHTLILGTHPSIQSLTQNQYYGHPLNAFWYIAGDSLGFRRSLASSPKTGKPYVYYHDHLKFGKESILEYPQQLERLAEKGFALWDIIGECEREGSLDEKIEEETVNPIREFCEGTLVIGGMKDIGKNVKRIVIANGTTGGAYFAKHFTDWFIDGKIRAADDELSQRVFKAVTKKAKKANNDIADGDGNHQIIQVVCMPSVSPAAASFTYSQKRDAWEKGCYNTGLKDYEEWRQNNELESNKQLCQTPKRKVAVDESFLTPISSKKSKSKTKSPKLRTPSSSSTKASIGPRIVSSDIAKLSPENEWIDLQVPPEELRPSATLTNGQCFNWIVVHSYLDENEGVDSVPATPNSAWGTHNAKEWVGPLQNRVFSIRETTTTTQYRVLHGPTEGAHEYLQHYFRLETKLAPLYAEWSKADSRLSTIAKCIPGVRILRQEPLECMFSFICSSNNNIPRITKMLSAFREKFGIFMLDIPTRSCTSDHNNNSYGESSISLFSFPTLASLASATDDELRDMGLGYRAKYIIETRDLLLNCGGEDYLLNLRSQQDPHVVQEALTTFSGIGRKVADCIALFSLDQNDAIPVDVHVQHIASRDYDPTVFDGAKSITPTIYKRVGDLFRERFRSHSGWAHSLLFVAELPSFREVLPADMLREMDEWREHEKQKKIDAKEKNAESKR